MLGNGHAHRAWQLVAVALDIVVEGEVRVELGVDLLRTRGVEHRGALVGPAAGGGLLHGIGHVGGNVLREVVLLVGHYMVGQVDAGPETLLQYRAQQPDKLLFKIVVDIGAGQANVHRLVGFVEALEDDGLEPSIVYLLGDILSNQCERPAPAGIRVHFHVQKEV